MATSAQQVYEHDTDDGSDLPGLPGSDQSTTTTGTTQPPPPPGPGEDTLPVTGLEAGLILLAAVLACGVGWAFRIGGRR